MRRRLINGHIGPISNQQGSPTYPLSSRPPEATRLQPRPGSHRRRIQGDRGADPRRPAVTMRRPGKGRLSALGPAPSPLLAGDARSTCPLQTRGRAGYLRDVAHCRQTPPPERVPQYPETVLLTQPQLRRFVGVGRSASAVEWRAVSGARAGAPRDGRHGASRAAPASSSRGSRDEGHGRQRLDAHAVEPGRHQSVDDVTGTGSPRRGGAVSVDSGVRVGQAAAEGGDDSLLVAGQQSGPEPGGPPRVAFVRGRSSDAADPAPACGDLDVFPAPRDRRRALAPE